MIEYERLCALFTDMGVDFEVNYGIPTMKRGRYGDVVVNVGGVSFWFDNLNLFVQRQIAHTM